MATKTEILRIKIETDGDGKVKASITGMGDEIKDVGKEVDALSAITKRAAGAILAAFSVNTIKNFGLSVVNAASEAERTTNKLTAILRAQGDAAFTTAGEVAELVRELENVSRFDGDGLRNAASVLLSFPNLTRDNFERALRAATDMAVLFDGDLSSSAVNLGRAISEPEEGLQALSRAGIRFDDTQKELIKNFLRTGQVGQAQNLILSEIERRMGGTAAAERQGIYGATRATTKAWGDFLEALGKTSAVQASTTASLGFLSRTLNNAATVLDPTIEQQKIKLINDYQLARAQAESKDRQFAARAKERQAQLLLEIDAIDALIIAEGKRRTAALAADATNQQKASAERRAQALREETAELTKQAEAIKAQVDPLFVYNRELEEYRKLKDRNLLNDEQWAAAVLAATDRYDEAADKLRGLNTEEERFVRIRENLLADLKKATAEAGVDIIEDERTAALARVKIAADEFRAKIEFAQVHGEERRKLEDALNEYIAAATKRAIEQSRTPIEQLAKDWADSAKQMEDATVSWADNAVDALVEFSMTGKNTFSDFANSVIRDLLRIQYQKGLSGIYGSLFGAGSSFGSGTGAEFAGAGAVAFAGGGVMTSQGAARLPVRTYASGGIANSPQVAVFGEGALPEAYVPLPDGRSIPVRMQGAGGGGTEVHVHNHTDASARVARERTADGRELINVVIGELAADVRRGGKVGQAISNTYGLSRTTAQR